MNSVTSSYVGIFGLHFTLISRPIQPLSIDIVFVGEKKINQNFRKCKIFEVYKVYHKLEASIHLDHNINHILSKKPVFWSFNYKIITLLENATYF